MAETEAEKNQPATQRRRQHAAEQGNVWQPRELAPAAAVATAALAMTLAGPGARSALRDYLADSLARAGVPTDDSLPLVQLAVQAPFALLAALAAAVAVVTIGLALVTTRHVSLAMLAPKWARISPVAGLGRTFSLGGLAGAATALAKLAAIAGIALAVVAPLVPALANIGDNGLATIGGGVVLLVGAAALAMLAIAAIDGGISWVLRERKLMMTLEEVKRESRENDGAPEVKAAIKRAQFAAASRRMRTSLADATVVVVNPVHFAVAMRYAPDIDAAPVVIEKGRLEMAVALIAVAREMAVPVIQTPRLARALFFTARPGSPVREELFGAVATILAFMMRFGAIDSQSAPAVLVPPKFDFDETGERRKPGTPLPI